jgi:serine/threonine-protein kinase RsbT
VTEGAVRTLPLASDHDVVRVRQEVRAQATALGFGLVDLTKLVTAASELGRNTLIHGGGGELRLEVVANGVRRGLRLTFEDRGPGIVDVERALQDGFSTGTGLGLGLGGARRLASEFSIESRVGEGTRVVITRWA